MELCIHELDESWCSYCNGKDAEHGGAQKRKPEPKTPKRKRKRKRAPVNREIRLAEQVAAGEVCGSCLTPFEPIGCQCARRERYHWQGVEVMSWVAECVENNLLDATRDGMSIAFQMQRRLGLRAGLSEDEHQADRLDILELLELDPKWTPVVRRHPDHLPV